MSKIEYSRHWDEHEPVRPARPAPRRYTSLDAALDLFGLREHRLVLFVRALTGVWWLIGNLGLLLFLLLLSVLYVLHALVRSPAAWIDVALFVWLAPISWPLLALCCLQMYMRRAPWLVNEYLKMLGVQEVTALWAIVLPGSVRLLGEQNTKEPEAPDGVMSNEAADKQTDRQTDQVSEADRWLDRIEVDRTRTAVIELLVYSGWGTGQIRGVLKGDSGAIGAEVDAARKRLGIDPPEQTLKVRDEKGERVISY